MNEITKKLALIQKELKVPKNQVNTFANYNYRNCEDILEAVKPLLKGAVLIMSDEMISDGGRFYVRATAIFKDGDEEISVSAYAREPESKKGMDESQITGSASSYARKYALNGLFAIDDTKDADTQDNTFKKTPVKKKEDDMFPDFDVVEESSTCEVCGKEVSRRVEEYSMDKYKKVLCMEHQLAHREIE